MSELFMAFDPSSSLSKAFYTIEPFELEFLAMEPEAIQVSASSIEQYLSSRPFTAAFAENEAWLEVGTRCYVVGFLAREHFCGNQALRVLKYERAVPKVLAMVGVIAAKKRLPQAFALELGILLPYGEYKDGERFEEAIAEALSDFSFRGRRYQVSLSKFDCLPEGGGLLMRGLEPGMKQTEGLVVMVGYRNASYLLMHKGAFVRGETKDLGFVQMLERVERATSGLEAAQIVGTVCTAGRRVKKSELSQLARSSSPRSVAAEVEQLVEAVKSARAQYWEMLRDWLRTRNFPALEQVILAGGTAYYYNQELERFFAKAQITWAEQLEHRVVRLLGQQQWEGGGLRYRLTDVCGYFFWLQYLFMGSPVRAQNSISF